MKNLLLFFFLFLYIWNHLFNMKELIFSSTLTQRLWISVTRLQLFQTEKRLDFFFFFFILAFTCHIQHTFLPIFSFIYFFNPLLGQPAVTFCPSHHSISLWVFFVSLQSKVLVVFMLLFGKLILLIIYVWGRILIHQMHFVLGFCKDLSYSKAFILQGLLCLS